MTNVTIMGLGLMGGSLGLALKNNKSYSVLGYTRSADRAKLALDRGAVDAMHDHPAGAVKDADIVVLCAPILAIPDQLLSVRDHLKAGAIVTDVGSTKKDVQRECAALLADKNAVFIGSHPIAGSEQQGMEAAREDLYEGAMVVVTPDDGTSPELLSRVENLWKEAGARVFSMTPLEHDKILALTSHLPHLMAAILSSTVGRSGLRDDLAQFCGTGFLDTARIAEGGTDIWMDILKSNSGPVIDELNVFREKLDSFIEKLEQKDFVAIEKALKDGRDFRKSFN